MKSEEFLQKVPLLTPSQGKHFGGCEILKAPQKRKKLRLNQESSSIEGSIQLFGERHRQYQVIKSMRFSFRMSSHTGKILTDRISNGRSPLSAEKPKTKPRKTFTQLTVSSNNLGAISLSSWPGTRDAWKTGGNSSALTLR